LSWNRIIGLQNFRINRRAFFFWNWFWVRDKKSGTTQRGKWS